MKNSKIYIVNIVLSFFYKFIDMQIKTCCQWSLFYKDQCYFIHSRYKWIISPVLVVTQDNLQICDYLPCFSCYNKNNMQNCIWITTKFEIALNLNYYTEQIISIIYFNFQQKSEICQRVLDRPKLFIGLSAICVWSKNRMRSS